VTLGRQLRRPDLPTAGARWCEAALPEGSVYRFLARERGRLFPPELFADLFQATGRRSVPPSILAVVMVLQRLEGLSDREAADRFAFDVRWRYAAGVADAVAGEETASFAHTVLVDLRARLRRSADPDRIFRVTGALARQVGLVGVRRVLDSAPLEDAVTTQDTVTMLRGAIRGLLRACPSELAAKVRGLLQREDDYRGPGKPACDWTDRQAREALVDELVRDAYRAHYALRGERLDPRVAEAAVLLATVTGQDIEETLTAACASSRAPLPTGSSPRWIQRRATGTRPPPTALTATRPTWPSTPTQRSSAPPRSARPAAATPPSRRYC
jgi:hypothetical protein